MAWENPVTTWGQAGKTVPVAGDFNRIEGNIQHLQDTKEAPAGAQAKANTAETNAKAYTDQEVSIVANDLVSHKNDKMKHIDYAVASGTNSYTATIQGITALVEGLSVKIKFQNANTGTATLNINGLGAKEIRKSNGNALSAGNIKAGQICHLVYTGSVFQLLGEGGEYGTAQPQHVLEGYTIGTEEGIKEGTMVNQGAKIITPSTVNQVIPAGYHNGQGYVEGSPNLVAANIKNGMNIFGVIGTLQPALVYKEDKSVTVGSGNNIYTFNVGFAPKVVCFEIQTNTGKTYISRKAAVIVGYKIYSLNNTLMTGSDQDNYVKVIEPSAQDNRGRIVYPDGSGTLYFQDVIISGNTVKVTLYASFAVTNPTVLSLVAVNFTS